MSDPRYPVGQFEPKTTLKPEERAAMIDQIAAAPARLREAVRGLTEKQLDTPYREGGWTLRQVVHHVPESHMNAYIRLKLALTEDTPTIKPYDEASWANLPDIQTPIETSLQLLDSLHQRWVGLMRVLPAGDFKRRFIHPGHGTEPLTLDWLVAMYSWHSRHHVAHITTLRERMRW